MVSDLFSRGRSTVDIDVVPTGAPRLHHSRGATAHIAVLVVLCDGICELCCRIVCGDVVGMPVFQVPSLPEGESEPVTVGIGHYDFGCIAAGNVVMDSERLLLPRKLRMLRYDRHIRRSDLEPDGVVVTTAA